MDRIDDLIRKGTRAHQPLQALDSSVSTAFLQMKHATSSDGAG